MKKIALAALLALAGTAHAGELYLGFGLGIAQVQGYDPEVFINSINDGSLSDGHGSNTDLGAKAFTGLALSRHFAVEGAFTNLGTYTAHATSDGTGPTFGKGSVSYEASAHAFSLSGKGILPVSRDISLYAKLGVARWNFEDKAINVPLASTTDSGTSPYMALGIARDIGRYLRVQAEAERFADVEDYDRNVVGIGIALRVP